MIIIIIITKIQTCTMCKDGICHGYKHKKELKATIVNLKSLINK